MKKLAVFSIFIMTNIICFGQTIHVPADYPSIQLGINAANNGDTVLVEQGTYFENINFMGKAIFVASHYIFEYDSSHIYNTIIDGSQPTNPDIGSVVTFDSDTDTTSCLLGFTITGGSGTKSAFIFPINVGGGIIFTNAGGRLVSNIILDNECIIDEPDGFVVGGGIGSGPPLEDHLIVIRKNIIRVNVAWTKGTSSAWNMGWAEGGGIYLCYNAIVEGNQIESNLCRSDNRISGGGGIRMIADPQSGTYQIHVEVRGNLIKNNESKSESFGAFAGGISCSAANTIIENNEITGNIIASQNYCKGAGLYLDLINTYYAKVNNNYIYNNTSSLTGISDGGAIGLFQSIDIECCNNLIINNSANNGGAFSINTSFPRLIANNTIVDNEADDEGGSFYIYGDSEVEILNSILRDNFSSGFPEEIYTESGSTVLMNYSNISDGWEGVGNINEDPEFIDSGDHPYSLDEDSPCIDAGTPDTTGLILPEFDLAGKLRIYGGGIDMGAYEYHPVVSIKDVGPFGISLHCYPNPFRTATTIQFFLHNADYLNIEICDINGKKIETLVSGNMQAGLHKITWNAKRNIKEGNYYIKLETNDLSTTTKVILIK